MEVIFWLIFFLGFSDVTVFFEVVDSVYDFRNQDPLFFPSNTRVAVQHFTENRRALCFSGLLTPRS